MGNRRVLVQDPVADVEGVLVAGQVPGFTLEQGNELAKTLQGKMQPRKKVLRYKCIKLESSNKSGRMFWVCWSFNGI